MKYSSLFPTNLRLISTKNFFVITTMKNQSKSRKETCFFLISFFFSPAFINVITKKILAKCTNEFNVLPSYFIKKKSYKCHKKEQKKKMEGRDIQLLLQLIRSHSILTNCSQNFYPKLQEKILSFFYFFFHLLLFKQLTVLIGTYLLSHQVKERILF